MDQYIIANDNGFCDAMLSGQQADAVKQWLEQNGVESRLIPVAVEFEIHGTTTTAEALVADQSGEVLEAVR